MCLLRGIATHDVIPSHQRDHTHQKKTENTKKDMWDGDSGFLCKNDKKREREIFLPNLHKSKAYPMSLALRSEEKETNRGRERDNLLQRGANGGLPAMCARYP